MNPFIPASLLALTIAAPALAQDPAPYEPAPYDHEYLTVNETQRAMTMDSIKTLDTIFKEAILPRDWDRLRELYADNYVQHSAGMEDGKEGVIKLFESIDYAQLVYETSLMIAEGPYVVAVSEFKVGDGPTLMAVDINFLRDGQSRVHWDILQPVLEETNASGRTPFDSAFTDAAEVDAATVEANKELVATFINVVFNRKEVGRISDFIGDVYYQHDQGAEDGAAQLVNDLKGAPDMQWDIKRIIAQNDLVLAHSRVTAAGQDYARADIWRVRDGMLVEHWSAQQEVPDEMLHRNGMF